MRVLSSLIILFNIFNNINFTLPTPITTINHQQQQQQQSTIKCFRFHGTLLNCGSVTFGAPMNGSAAEEEEPSECVGRIKLCAFFTTDANGFIRLASYYTGGCQKAMNGSLFISSEQSVYCNGQKQLGPAGVSYCCCECEPTDGCPPPPPKIHT